MVELKRTEMYRLRQPIMDRLMRVENENKMLKDLSYAE